MAPHSPLAVARVGCFCGCAILITILATNRSTGQIESAPAMRLADLGLKFDGARTCAAADCHGKKGDVAPPTEIGHEYTIWRSGQDKHALAFDTLGKDDSKAIGEKMPTKIADTKTSAACLACHALNVPAKLHGDEFSIKEGNTCASCHGPSEKWLKPHQDKAWTEAQRKKAGSHAALLKEWGLYDTKPVSARAQICAGCHLAIDADMIAAGHPQPKFELDWYSEIEPKHWMDPRSAYFGTKLWLAGQVVSLRDAMHQLEMRAKQKKSPELVKAAAQQAMAHLSVLKPAASIVGLDAAALESAAKELTAAVADPAANAEKIATKAAAVAAMANGAVGKLDAVQPNAQVTKQVLAAIANDAAMCKDCGRDGMEQQSWAIAALYNAFASAENVAAADKKAVNALIQDTLMPQPEGDVSAD